MQCYTEVSNGQDGSGSSSKLSASCNSTRKSAAPALHAYTGKQVKFKGDGYWAVLRDVSEKFMKG